MENLETATFGAGCFWCVEAIFKRISGVQSVTSGYSGGNVENPSYEQVCSGDTGHAETTQIMFDPKIISYKELVKIFFLTHDPTTINRQGNDEGTQYRSVIFYHNDEQKKIAEEVKAETEKSKVYSDPIITEIEKFDKFYPAENYHQDYYAHNKNAPYCRIVIDPKIKHLRDEFADKLKKDEDKM